MRRLTAIPVKTSAVAVLIMAGAAYMAAEARQTVIRRQRLEIARMENAAQPPDPTGSDRPALAPTGTQSAHAISTAAPALVKAAARPQSDEQAAEKQAASLPIQKPALTRDRHTRKIVISISHRRLALVEDGKVAKIYPIAVGAHVSPSPDGEFAVINHAVRPTYRHGGKEILPGKDNPLGTRWIGLSLKGYGIHGTNVPSSIGKAASHGCFRMGQADVEDLYSRVQVGDTVTIRRERDELITQIFDTPVTVATNQMATKIVSQTDSQIATPAINATSPAIQGQP